MTSNLVDRVIAALVAVDIPAVYAWTGGEMPYLTQPKAAVCLDKVDYTQHWARVAVTVAVSVEMCGGVCEAAALRAGGALEALGGEWVQESCKFTGYTDTCSIRLLGTFSGPEVTEDWTSATALTVKLGSVVQPRAVGFRAEQKVDEDTGEILSGAQWFFRLEERFRHGEGPLPSPVEPFDLKVDRPGGTETYKECRWIGLQLENTATGLRQVRQGVAKSRSFMTLV